MWKILTSDGRPPMQGGDPIFDSLPCLLPAVPCDTGPAVCAHGWNFVRNIETGFKIAGLWRTGRPNVVLAVEPVGDHVERGDKLRAAQLRLLRHATEDEIKAAGVELTEF